MRVGKEPGRVQPQTGARLRPAREGRGRVRGRAKHAEVGAAAGVAVLAGSQRREMRSMGELRLVVGISLGFNPGMGGPCCCWYPWLSLELPRSLEKG